jgi:hypothetical protein
LIYETSDDGKIVQDKRPSAQYYGIGTAVRENLWDMPQ